MTKTRRQRRAAVNNVTADKPKSTSKGSEVYAGSTSMGFAKYSNPLITVKVMEDSEQNAVLADPVRNVKRLMFKDAPTYNVFDENGEEDPDLSQVAKNIGTNIKTYAKAQWCFNDSTFGGACVLVFEWGKQPTLIGDRTVELTVPVKCKHLPWNSFNQEPGGYTITYNPIMPGIVIDDEGNIHVFQVQDKINTLVEIPEKHPSGETCFKIIKDPSSPDPAGLPDCLPVIPLVTMYNYANNADNQRMNRVGAPSVFIRVDELTADNEKYIQAFIERWGKDTGFFLPNKGWEMVNPFITDSATASERLKFIKSLIDSYFNPATVLAQATGGASMGRSDAAAGEMLNARINNTLSWIEDGFEDIFNEMLEINGYKGYYCEIEFPRAIQRNDSQILNDLTLAANKGAITKNELRQSLPSIQFPKVEDDPTFDEPISAGGSQNPFSGFGGYGGTTEEVAPVGNVESPIRRTNAYEDIENDLLSEIRKTAEIVKKEALKEIEKGQKKAGTVPEEG